jgi:ATP-dependent helicase/nuclease subunit B
MTTRTLLIGPAGAGKTRAVMDAVRPLLAPQRGGEAGLRRFLVLVPTYSQAEHLKRRFLRQGGLEGLLDRGVVTFEQLAERRTGVRLASLAPAAVRDAILAAAFAEDESAAGAGVFAKVARFPGFRRSALRFLDEVKSLEPDPAVDVVAAAADRLAAAAGALAAERAETMRALVRVLSIYERRRRAEGLLDHGDLLRELLRLLREPRGDAPRWDLFAMDGFTDLTPVQEAIVHRLANASDRSLVTLLGDAEDRAGSPFAATDDLRARLVSAGFRAELLGATRRAGLLAALERTVAGERREAGDVPAIRQSGIPDGPATSVRFLAGADPDDEADRVARTVLGWTTEGTQRGEILVVVRSIASDTAARIAEALQRHGVPARRMGGEPLLTVACARSALRVVTLLAGRGEVQVLLDAVRHGDAHGVTDADGDRLDRLVRRRGVADEEALLALADGEARAPTAAAWLRALAAVRPVAEPRPPSETARALLAPVRSLLRLRFAAPFDDGDEAAVARDAAAMRAFRDLAADLVRALRAAETAAIAPGEFADRLAASADAARFRATDLRDDAVNVVDAEEARQWEARAVVVAGLRMGEFPAAAREDLFLSDEERAGIEKATGMRLPNRLDQALRREHLLFYSAATRATERLVLTAPVADEAGNPLVRSPFLDMAMTLLPPEARVLEGRDRSPGDVRPAPGETFHRADLERTALAALTERFAPGQPSEIRPHTGYALLPSLVAKDDTVVRGAARWFHAPEPRLRDDGAARRALSAARMRSATSLADFAQCPFRHFARKGLRLEAAPGDAEEGIDALLAGTIAHSALERAVKAGVTSETDAAAIVDEVFRGEAGHLRRDLRVEAVRAELRRVVAAAVRDWAARGGIVAGFVPRHFEWAFGAAGPRVAAGEGAASVALTGAADRIDVDAAGRAIVLDYKWSKASRFQSIERKITEGLDLQLPIYAIAARKALGLRVVATGYVTLRDEDGPGTRWLPVTEDSPVKATARSGPPEGWGLGDGEGGLSRAEVRIVDLDRKIRSGACATDPADPDRCGAGACPYADLCRYEGKPRAAAEGAMGADGAAPPASDAPSRGEETR